MGLGLRACTYFALALMPTSFVCLTPSPCQGQSAIPTLTVRADAQTKTYGQKDPAFTYQYAGFTNGDTASVLSGQPALAAPQRVQNLWEFTESLPGATYSFWQFQGDGKSQPGGGIALSHVTSAGNFYSSIDSSILGLSSPIVYPGMQYLVSFYALSNSGGNQFYWHRYLGDGNSQGWGPTATGPDVRRVAFSCAGTANGALDCGEDPTVSLGSGTGGENIYWLFLGANNAFGHITSTPNFQQSVAADLYIGGFQIEPAVTEKRGVLAMGDSLTQYDCSGVDRIGCTSWTSLASSLLDVPFYNRGIGGDTCESVQARWSTDASPILAANAGYAIISCGTNDIAVGLSEGQIEPSNSAMYNLSIADGATPVVVTIGPFAATVAASSAEATRQAVNAWMRSTFPLVLDFDKVNADPANLRQQNPAYFDDGTHLNLAGRIAEGNYVAQSISGNAQGYPGIWKFHAPIPYQPVPGLNPSNGMDFSPGPQREAGNYIILPSAGTLASSTYKFAFSSALLAVTPASLAVGANTKTITFGEPLPVLDGSLSGALPADNISATYSTSATGASLPGTYPVVPALADPKNRLPNYSITQMSGTLTILAPPVAGSLSPPYAAAGSAGFTLAVKGSGFTSDSVVHWSGSALATQFVSSSNLSAQVPGTDVAHSGIAAITVQSTVSAFVASNTLQFGIDSNAVASNGPTFTPSTAAVTPGSAATYPVTLPPTATNVTVACLNLPAGVACSYSPNSGAVTIATSSSTLKGSYQIVVVFTETLPGASVLAVFPIFLLPFAEARRRWRARWLVVGLTMVVAAGLVLSGCGGASQPGSSLPTASSHQVTSSGAVMLNVQ